MVNLLRFEMNTVAHFTVCCWCAFNARKVTVHAKGANIASIASNILVVLVCEVVEILVLTRNFASVALPAPWDVSGVTGWIVSDL